MEASHHRPWWNGVLMLLCLTGPGSALQYPLQYHYHYSARVAAGIPEVNARHSAVSDIRAELMVYATGPATVTFSLQNVETGEFHGEFDCEGATDQPLPTGYTTPTDGPGALIGLHPFGYTEGVLQFDSAEELWVVNFYKSIVALFVTQPMKETFFGSSNANYSGRTTGYTVEEDTIMGRCLAIYTQQKISGATASLHEHFASHHITGDVQLGQTSQAYTSKTTGRKTTGRKTTGRKTTGRKTTGGHKTGRIVSSSPTIDRSLWKVIRSVSLEYCSAPVEHQHSLTGIRCDLSRDQCSNLYSRNSHGEYVLRGDEGGYRIELADLRGAIQISPYGYPTEHLMHLTKQKLALVSVQTLDADIPHMDAPASVQSLIYELTVPYGGTAESPYPWIKLGSMADVMYQLTGVSVNEEMRQEKKRRVIQMIKDSYDEIQSISGQGQSQAPVMLNYATIMLYDCTDEEMREVVDIAKQRLSAEALVLFYGVLAEVGTLPAITAMLEGIASGQVTPVMQVTFFGMLNSNIKSAQSLRPLLDFLKAENVEATPFKTTQSMVNFASLVNRLCLARNSGADTWGAFNRVQCYEDNIVGEMEQFLITKLEGTDVFWKQMILVQALVNLNTTVATNALLPYILGRKACDTFVRAVAMDSLAGWNTAGRIHTVARKITAILLDIFENPAEPGVLRARALGYICSWPMSSTVWTRLAFSTQRPGLNDLSAFTYSIIKHAAEYEHPAQLHQRQKAVHALKLAKAASPSRRYSSHRTFISFSMVNQIGGIDHLGVLEDPMSPIPAEVEIFTRRSLGGGLAFARKMDMMISGDNGNLVDIFNELFRNSPRPFADTGKDGQWKTFIEMLKSGLPIVEQSRGLVRGLFSFIPTQGMQLFVPLDYAILSDLYSIMFPERSKHGPNGQFGAALKGPSSMYLNRFDITFVTVNDLGLPVITSVAAPTVFHFKGSTDFGPTAPDQYELSSEDSGIMIASTLRTNVDTMVTWSRNKVATGVSLGHSYQIPINMNFDLTTWPRSDRPWRGLELNLSPTSKGNVTLINLINEPYTIMGSKVPGDLMSLATMKKTVHVLGVRRGRYYLKDTGPMDATVTYDADIGHFMSDAAADKLHPSLITKLLLSSTLKYWSVDLTVDLTGREESKVVFTITQSHVDPLNSVHRVSIYGQDEYSEGELCGQARDNFEDEQSTGQQQNADYDYFNQRAVDSEVEDFGSSSQQQAASTAGGEGVPEQRDISGPQLLGYLRYLQEKGGYLRDQQREVGWKDRIDGVSGRVEVNNWRGDGKVDAMEITWARTICNSLPDQQKIKKIVVYEMIDNPCWTTCYEFETVQPKLNDLDTLETIKLKNLTRTTHGYKLFGERCSLGPLEEVDLTRWLSEEASTKMFQRLNSCNDPAADLVYEVLRETSYQDFGAIPYHERPYYHKRLNGRQQFAPQCEFDSTPIAFTIIAQLTGPMESGNHGMITGEQWISRALPKLVEKISGWAAADPTSLASTYDYEPVNRCVIGEHSLTTFDGLHTNLTVDGCPTLAATSCEALQFDSFAVAVREARTGGLAVDIAVHYMQQVINIGPEGVQINGEHMGADVYVQDLVWDSHYSPEGVKEVAGHVYKRRGAYKVQIKDTLDVLYKDGKVYINLAAKYNGFTCGICGNLDNEPSNDMKKPDGCYVTSPEEFRKSWVPSSSFSCVSFSQGDDEQCLKDEPLPRDYYESQQL